MDCVIVLTTLPADADGRTFAETLVTEGLAACVSVGSPMESVYRWNGELTRDAERQIVIKTTVTRLLALQARVRELHPYEVPEFVVVEASASDAYGQWIAEQTITQ